eukprot:CAMPEP_0117548138 /NCGR_PEP_ID=MMETSP0784-20121206/47498_1 /TAXON_ID=39447 /ORGANISM="" /LENGTH=73 /DNA_ID=CAMNT_0005345091 /DNA_START=384 /DNA_END=605 /DNA_ORIENTATION=+
MSSASMEVRPMYVTFGGPSGKWLWLIKSGPCVTPSGANEYSTPSTTTEVWYAWIPGTPGPSGVAASSTPCPGE